MDYTSPVIPDIVVLSDICNVNKGGRNGENSDTYHIVLAQIHVDGC